MNKILKYSFPGLFGLLIYMAIRLITDTASGFNVLLYRNQWTNAFEIISAFLIGYIIWYVLRKFEAQQSQKYAEFSLKNILKEFGMLILISFITLNCTVGVVTMVSDDGMDKHDFVVINLIPLLFILTYYSIRRGNSLLKSYIHQKTELERIKRDKTETELSFLKSQYHPHFLFNALNTVYFQMDDSIETAKKTIEKLSDLLRYQLYEDHHQKVPLVNELNFITKYANLQSERLPEGVSVKVSMNYEGDATIYPLLSMPLVENAFKYVGGKIKWIDVSYEITQNTITFIVKNSVNSEIADNRYSGVGLTNLQRRLELLYPNQYEFNTDTHQGEFTAELTLPIQ
ncbi:MAG: sensor histidine kinase [Marinoscillum sp.]